MERWCFGFGLCVCSIVVVVWFGLGDCLFACLKSLYVAQSGLKFKILLLHPHDCRGTQEYVTTTPHLDLLNAMMLPLCRMVTFVSEFYLLLYSLRSPLMLISYILDLFSHLFVTYRSLRLCSFFSSPPPPPSFRLDHFS